MTKRSFIEEELARESKSRVDSQKPSLKQRFNQLLHKEQKNISTNQESLARPKYVITSKAPDPYDLSVSPNEIRFIYECPTISNEPESIRESHLKNNSPSSNIMSIYNRLASESLYNSAIQAMHTYGKGD